ncbi:FtsQ-type POTRA domain-containing protein [Pikeienuella piscinae]|uniref:Cell division protein FtsQ n=1 Tax=Pikeienuella piscinae TaxID=2748098 RepID=A0A7M3T6M5_9RHOB|nr:cell division protein FtsQ/DivIB [Pikeienuella piscinae]QIE57656.1 FtsQ-type POTRA domain-containing protein [Pikeienuella piscinae]
MRALIRRVRRPDPAPSRLGFRLKRHWRSPAFRRSITVHAPLGVLLAALGWAGAQPGMRQAAMDRFETIRSAIVARPEFAIRHIEVRGASPMVTAELQDALAPWLGASSLAADAAAIRAAVDALGWVENASARLVAPETLIVTVKERVPAAIWRMGPLLMLLDAKGERIAPIEARAERPDLPVLAGQGADKAASEGLAVIAAAAGGVAQRLRGLVRVGERRWDAVIADGPVIMLPSSGAVEAMGYIAALDAGENVLDRDISHVDLRVQGRPTLRLTPDGLATFEVERKPKKPGKDA